MKDKKGLAEKWKIYYFPILGTVVYQEECAGKQIISTNYLIPDIHYEGSCFWDDDDDVLLSEYEQKVLTVIPSPNECYLVCCDYFNNDGEHLEAKVLGVEWAGKKSLKKDWEKEAKEWFDLLRK